MKKTLLRTVGGIILSLVIFFGIAVPAYAAVPNITSAKITGPNTVTLVFSEAVSTSIGSYTNLSGNLNGRNIIAVNGSGSNTINLTFDGGSLPANATGGLTIGGSTVSLSDNSPFGGSTVNIADAQIPVLTSFTLSSNNVNNTLAGVGNVIMISFTVNEPVVSPSVTVDGHALSINGSGNGPFTAQYTLTSNDSSASIPVALSFNDYANNSGRVSMIMGNQSTAGTSIASITSNANTIGSLKIGDSIYFTLTPATISPNATISGSYNNVPLSWTTQNNGQTYNATYTVIGGNNDATSPLQISNVTLTDVTGSVSAPASGNDILRTIDAHGPLVSEVSPVLNPSANSTPSYVFSSSENGTITYGGDCSSGTVNASAGNNTIIFNPLAIGLHNNCVIAVRDYAGNTGNQMLVTPFSVTSTVASSVVPTSSPSTSSGTTGVTSTSAAIQSLLAQIASLQNQSSTVPAAASIYKFNNPLDLGSKGEDVRQLQLRLTAEGVYSGPANGTYGPLTEAAVKHYQKAHGLSQLGNVGPGTRAALNG